MLGGSWTKQKSQGSESSRQAAIKSPWCNHVACWAASHPPHNYQTAMSDPACRAAYYTNRGLSVPPVQQRKRHPVPGSALNCRPQTILASELSSRPVIKVNSRKRKLVQDGGLRLAIGRTAQVRPRRRRIK